MDGSIKDFQKAQILLQEYNTLRTEVLSRYVAQFQSGGVTAIILLGIFNLFANQGFSWWYVGLVILDLGLYAGALIWIDTDIYKAAWRLREIEKQVNALGGETFLVWEHKYGLGGIVAKRLIAWGLFTWPPQSK